MIVSTQRRFSHGVNRRQRFARDAALIAARACRRGESDPLQSIHAPLDFDDQLLSTDPRLDIELRQLISGFASARAITDVRAATTEPDFATILEVARAGLLATGGKCAERTWPWPRDQLVEMRVTRWKDFKVPLI